jgi:hypothetical protein
MSSIDDNKRTVQRYFELMSRNDVAALAEIYDDSKRTTRCGSTRKLLR